MKPIDLTVRSRHSDVGSLYINVLELLLYILVGKVAWTSLYLEIAHFVQGILFKSFILLRIYPNKFSLSCISTFSRINPELAFDS